MFIRTRIIRGRRYRYAEYRWREGQHVRSKSVCLSAGDLLGGTTLILALLLRHAVTGGSHANYSPTKHISPDRERKVLDRQREKLDAYYAVNKTTAEAYRTSITRLSPELREERFSRETALMRAYYAEKDAQRAAHRTEAQKAQGAATMAQITEFTAARAADAQAPISGADDSENGDLSTEGQGNEPA
jgi:hypothetical protein